MHRFKRLITAIFLTVLSIILLLSLSFAYLIVTPLGGKLLVRCFKQEFSSVGLMHIGHYQGTLQDGFILKDIRITGLSYLPGSLLRIQQIDVRLPLWDVRHYDLDIFNARIFIPGNDPVVFTGKVHAGQIKGNLYGSSVDLHTALRFWASEDIRKNLLGFISNIDVNIQGPLDSPQLSGSFLADNIRYKATFFTDGVSHLDVTLVPLRGQIQVKGDVIIDSGLVKVRNVNLKLSQSKFTFQEDIFNPIIEIHLGSRVEDMDIYLTIKGTSSDPQLTVISDPPMAAQEALQVLFTGNAWSSSTSPFSGVTSGELAENFLDYSLQDIHNDQDLGFKTKLTDNLKLGAEMDQTPLPPGEMSTYYSRKINGEMDMTDHMSLNVSHEVFPQYSYPSYQDAQPQTADTQVYVQYKKRF
jgi:autotransporter translocation and assembly factor TamB